VTDIYLNGATLMTTPTATVVSIARQTGYRGIEARAERLLEDKEEVRQAARMVRPREVLTLNGVALTVRSDGRMDRNSIEHDLDERLAICRELQSPYLLAIPPRAPGLSSSKAVPGTREALELARDRAAGSGVGIAFEYLGFGDCPINTLELAAETVNGIDAVELVLDSCHWHASGGGALTTYPVERLALVHLNDAPAKPPRQIEDADRVLPGEGVIDLRKLLAQLRRGGFQGPFSLETFNPRYWREEAQQVAHRGMEALEQVVSADGSAR
jgi:2-keto-myo-inositol isomerase